MLTTEEQEKVNRMVKLWELADEFNANDDTEMNDKLREVFTSELEKCNPEVKLQITNDIELLY